MNHKRFADWITILVVHLLEWTGRPNYLIGPDVCTLHSCNSWYDSTIKALATYFRFSVFQEGQLSVTGESMCTKYWLTA